MKTIFKPIHSGAAALLLLAVAPMRAEEANYNPSLGAAVTFSTDSLKKATNNSLGFSVYGSVERPIASSNVFFRPGLAISVFPGKLKDDYKTQLTNLQGSFDVVIPSGLSESFKVVTGISINQWRFQGRTERDKPHPYNLDGSYAPGAMKIGFRIGANYKFGKHWSGELLLQMVEFGNRNQDSSEADKTHLNPGWVQAGFRYHF